MLKQNFSFLSSNGTDTVKGFVIRKPNPEYKAIILISHGMIEHSGRYEDFMEFMAEKGYVMAIHDHLGHKNSVSSDENLGYFAKENGYLYILSDLATSAARLKKSFPQLKLILLGHSMGSFYARVFAAKYPHLLDGLMISGTGGKNPLAKIANIVLNTMIMLKGDRYRSKFVSKLTFKGYLSKIDNPKTPIDWITSDQDIINKNLQDKYCCFTFTLSGYKDLAAINSLANSENCFNHTPKNIPYLMFSGDMDPVGGYGKGVREVYENYKKFGVNDITLNLYPNGRHEMLNEVNRQQVYSDILNWLESRF